MEKKLNGDGAELAEGGRDTVTGTAVFRGEYLSGDLGWVLKSVEFLVFHLRRGIEVNWVEKPTMKIKVFGPAII